MVSIVITKQGLEKIAGATVEEPLVLEKFAVGDGGGQEIEPNEDMTSLANEKHRDYINDKYSNGNNITCECVISSDAKISEGFYVREIGLFDVDGVMIAIAKTPLQFRPGSDGGNIVTELMFSIVLQVSNSAAITIEIPQTIFATTDALDRLLKRVEKIEKDKQDLINSSIGIEKWFNSDNQYKDKNIVTIGIKTYALMDSSNILKIAEYPTLFKNIGATDKGDGTFAMPNFYDGTTRHLPKGSSRLLGTFEDDAMQRFTASFGTGGEDNAGLFFYARGGCKKTERQNKNAVAHANYGGDRSSAVEIDTALTCKTDEKETRMKNTAGQWYMLAKVNV